MSANQSTKHPITVAIIHGWAEGGWLSKRFADTLTRRGFRVIDDPGAADIVFAHSLGCYLIPSDVRARQILLVGVPSVSTRLLPIGLARKLAKEAVHHRVHGELGWWCKKVAYGLWCALTQPHNTYYLFSRRDARNLPDARNRKVLVVRPADDPFAPEDARDFLESKNYGYVELKGMHDNCWLDPEVYADLLVTSTR